MRVNELQPKTKLGEVRRVNKPKRMRKQRKVNKDFWKRWRKKPQPNTSCLPIGWCSVTCRDNLASFETHVALLQFHSWCSAIKWRGAARRSVRFARSFRTCLMLINPWHSKEHFYVSKALQMESGKKNISWTVFCITSGKHLHKLNGTQLVLHEEPCHGVRSVFCH